MKLISLGIMTFFFVQMSFAMELIASVKQLVSQIYSTVTPSRRGKFTGLSDECRKKIFLVCDLIKQGDFAQADKVVDEISYDSEYWKYSYYANFMLQSAMRAEHIPLLSRMLGNIHLSSSCPMDCLGYAMILKSLPSVKLICFHLYRRCCKSFYSDSMWNHEYFLEVKRKCRLSYIYGQTTDEIRTYIDTFWDSVDPENPGPRLQELEKIWTHRSLEKHSRDGLIDGLIKGTESSFVDEHDETLSQKARRLGYRDFEEIIDLYDHFKRNIFDIIKQINTHDDSGRCTSVDREKICLLISVLSRCPVFLHTGFRDDNGDTVLHAVIYQSVDLLVKHVVRLSLRNRYAGQVLLNCRNNKGHTPLEIVVGLGKFELLKSFLNCAYFGKEMHVNRAAISVQSVASCVRG